MDPHARIDEYDSPVPTFSPEDARLRLERLIMRIDLSTFSIPTILEARLIECHPILAIIIQVDHRPNDPNIGYEKGLDTFKVTFTKSIDREVLRNANDRTLFCLIRKHLVDAYTHELDEHIIVDGQREFDPHKQDRWKV